MNSWPSMPACFGRVNFRLFRGPSSRLPLLAALVCFCFLFPFFEDVDIDEPGVDNRSGVFDTDGMMGFAEFDRGWGSNNAGLELTTGSKKSSGVPSARRQCSRRSGAFGSNTPGDCEGHSDGVVAPVPDHSVLGVAAESTEGWRATLNVTEESLRPL